MQSGKPLHRGIPRRPRMVTLLITSFLLIAGITYAIYLWQRPSSNTNAGNPEFPPPRARGLFEEQALNEPPPLELPQAISDTAEERRRLLERAEAGDKAALLDAQQAARHDAAVYDEVMEALAGRANSDKSLLALVSYVVRSDSGLRVTRRLAERFIESWKSAPDRHSTTKMLHVAALANDAALYQRAVETAYQFWRDRRLTEISADELRQLIEGEFWLLAPEVRASGAGFLLKRKLAHVGRRLVAANEKDEG